MDDRQTKIPDLLFDISTVHAEKLAEALAWMEMWGAELWNSAESDAHRADFNLSMYHENDMIECGGAIPDPNFEHYYIVSWSEITVRVPLGSLQLFLQACDQYTYWSDTRWGYDPTDEEKEENAVHKAEIDRLRGMGIFLDTDTNNQFVMESRIHFSSYSHEYCEVRLKWEVFHTFNER